MSFTEPLGMLQGEPDGEWSGRVVVITGAAGGVGRTVTRAWLESGAKVLAVDATGAGHEALTSELGTTDRFATYVTDLSTEAGANTMMAFCRETFGIPDTLIHLVGGFAMSSIDGPDSVRNWDKMMKLNLQSAFITFRAMIPCFRELGRGWIVGMSSKAVAAPGPGIAAYAAAKAGLQALAASMSEELKSENIHINLIVASTIDTPANRSAMPDAVIENWVRPMDIADATLFLCSDRAGSIYGATLEVHGRS